MKHLISTITMGSFILLSQLVSAETMQPIPLYGQYRLVNVAEGNCFNITDRDLDLLFVGLESDGSIGIAIKSGRQIKEIFTAHVGTFESEESFRGSTNISHLELTNAGTELYGYKAVTRVLGTSPVKLKELKMKLEDDILFVETLKSSLGKAKCIFEKS